MEVSQAIRSRRAVRDFTNAPVSIATLRQVIAAASWAPSAMNGQPWHFTVVTDPVLLDRISHEAKAWALSNTPQLRQSDHFRDLLSDPAFHLLYNAPALIVISAPAEGPWAIEDCAVAAQNLMLAAVELGLGTCWIGFAQGWLASEAGRRLLNLPEQRVIAPITIGYPRAPAPVVARKAVMLSWIGERPAASEPPAQTAH